MKEYDLIVIGAGPGGYNLAAGARAKGWSVLLIEKNHPGGTCLNRGCIPTKALRAAAKRLQECRSDSEFGISCTTGELDYGAVHGRMEKVVDELRQGVEMMLEGVDRINAEAAFTGPNTVKAADEEYTAGKIVIATGSKPAMLPVPGADLCIDSDGILAADTLPESIIIIGGGVIGMEFACILNAFGVKVTVIEYCQEILPPFDAEVSKRLRTILKRKGIAVITGAAVTAIEADGDSRKVIYTAKGKEKSETAQKVLMAVGRRPVVPQGATEAGIALTSRGFVDTNESLKTSIEGVYAIGDVNGRSLLAHSAEAQAEALLSGEDFPTLIPGVAFTDPECAMVGVTEQNAPEGYKTGKAIFRSNGYAMAIGETDGFVKVITDAEGKLIGAHIIGPGASELVAEAALAIDHGLSARDLSATVHAHPTLSETLAAACRQCK